MNTEAQILEDLFSKWISLALEYASGAPDLRAVYVYASSEVGSTFANVYFDQAGEIKFPDDIDGADTSISRVSQVQDLLVSDLFDAHSELQKISVPPPTEYRVYYEPVTRKLDVQLSREFIYVNDPEKIPERGIEYWLGEKAPKLF